MYLNAGGFAPQDAYLRDARLRLGKIHQRGEACPRPFALFFAVAVSEAFFPPVTAGTGGTSRGSKCTVVLLVTVVGVGGREVLGLLEAQQVAHPRLAELHQLEHGGAGGVGAGTLLDDGFGTNLHHSTVRPYTVSE